METDELRDEIRNFQLSIIDYYFICKYNLPTRLSKVSGKGIVQGKFCYNISVKCTSGALITLTVPIEEYNEVAEIVETNVKTLHDWINNTEIEDKLHGKHDTI